jgi:hypothetical protein
MNILICGLVGFDILHDWNRKWDIARKRRTVLHGPMQFKVTNSSRIDFQFLTSFFFFSSWIFVQKSASRFNTIDLAEKLLGSEARNVMKYLFDHIHHTDNPVQCLKDHPEK